MTQPVRTGGCQCGWIRFRLTGMPADASICHCRMCQKAFGGYFAPLVNVGKAELVWTRGALKYFQSSNHVRRGFCGNCGTPMTYEAPDGVSLSAGSFDDPASLPPIVQYGVEGKLDFVDRLHTLPQSRTTEDFDDVSFLSDIVSRQHPDHDTAAWPPEKMP
ncbi:GFA family protein [Sphingobium sp. AS12]|uniref:GFA family protein n=1 Tax=Sphingobium sp. AS12 TaxID=2849495 RepID=UPI001C31E7DA|nr:GFA family protein [Sphingobium sp. AS12]MBV2150123.1 GFA family protein [Sphingobium sp. AS12]